MRLSYSILLAGVFIIALAGAALYFRIASVYGPYANPNYRSLHQRVTPRGGGIVIAASVLGVLLWLYCHGVLGLRSFLVFFAGGCVVGAAGFADDRFDIKPKYRLVLHFLAASWIAVWFGGLPPIDFGFTQINLGVFGHTLLVLACLWFYNLYNFIDGIDAMASAATIFIGVAMGLVMAIQGQSDLALILGSLAVASIGFLMFNWPPAKMFLGDSGSSFISYILSAVMLASLARNAASIWVWLIVFAYYFSDTTSTTLVRALTLSGWYLPHRSHAYQNLARVWDNHLRMVLIVMAINLFWLLPIAIFAFRNPPYAPLATLIAYVPVTLFCLKYGPLFENQ